MDITSEEFAKIYLMEARPSIDFTEDMEKTNDL
jgi:hypothetical protein